MSICYDIGLFISWGTNLKLKWYFIGIFCHHNFTEVLKFPSPCRGPQVTIQYVVDIVNIRAGKQFGTNDRSTEES